MMQLLPYFLMLFSICVATANSGILHVFGNRDIRNMGDTFFFNGGIALVWVVLLSAFSLASGDLALSGGSVLYGCIYGVIICMFLLFKNLAVTSGPVSLTTLIGSCPFLLTTLFGVLFLKQEISAGQSVGTVLILLSLFLCLAQKKPTGAQADKPQSERLTLRWAIYSVLFFLAGGGVGIVYMLFGASEASTEINGMMLCAALVATVLYFAIGLLVSAARGEGLPRIHKSGIRFLLLCGAASCTYMRLNLYLSTVIPSVVFFPVSNGSLVLLSTVMGWLLFKERLSLKQTLGMAVGLAAIVIVGVA